MTFFIPKSIAHGSTTLRINSGQTIQRQPEYAGLLVDPKGNLIFYNEPAEEILRLRFGETGSMKVEEWATVFKPEDIDGNPLPPDGLPLVQTLATQKPAHGSF